MKIPRTREANEDYLNKLMLIGYYKESVVIDLLERIIKYDDISLSEFCTGYIKDTNVTKPMVQCELVQYVADKGLGESEEALLACEDILGSMGAVFGILEVIKEDINIRDIVEFTKYKDTGVSEEIICSELASYMFKTGIEVRDTKFIHGDDGLELYYAKKLINTGNAAEVVSFDLVDNVVTLTAPEFGGSYISYYLGNNEVGYDGFESYDDKDDWDNREQYGW